MPFEPKADRAFTDSNFIWSDHNELLIYINQLRYERLMAKAAYFHEHGVMLTDGWGCEAQCDRIAEAYEARAERIKEQM